MDNQQLVSGVIICAPPPVAEFVQTVRGLHAESNSVTHVLPPHITLLYPFVSLGNDQNGLDPAILTETTAQLRAVCQDVVPFSITLDRYSTFPGRVLFLAPAETRPLVALHERLQRAFPQYPLYGGDHSEIVPHLTISVVDSQAALDSLSRPAFSPFTFEVRELHFVYGDATLCRPWTDAAVIPLGDQA